MPIGWERLSSLIFQYVVGGIVFLVGMILVFKSDVVNLKLKQYRRAVGWMIAAFFIYVTIHSFFQLVTPKVP